MAVEMIGLLWPALGPETLAASCRASLAVGYPGLLMAATPFDQAAEIAARLDDIWQAAQDDPSAAVVTLTPPLLQRVIPESHAGRPRRVTVEPELLHQAVELDHPGDPADIPEPLVEDHPGDAEPITQAAEPDPEPPATPLPVPPDWWSVPDVCELLGLHRATISRWRLQGRLGLQGVDWMRSGRSFALSPALVDRLLSEPASGGAEVPAAPTCHQG